ncbi:MAG: NAD-dependent epimerase/dehydratase family protein [Parachlamydiaceae bacterium]
MKFTKHYLSLSFSKQIALILIVLAFSSNLLNASEKPTADQKTVLICGAGGFIGYHLTKQYKAEGYWVRGVDFKYPEFTATGADEFLLLDLRLAQDAETAVAIDSGFDEVCQLAADMGGMGFISTHDAQIMHNSALINIHVLEECRKTGVRKVFYTSSACIYPERNQLDPENPQCSEDSAYPAAPDTEYGWEKLFSERLYQSYARDYKMDVRIARLHNVFGPQGAWKGGREKAPAALCRKVAQANDGDSIQIWGKGDQTRSFLYVTDCVEGIRRIMKEEQPHPVMNLGSEEMISINDLALLIAKIAGKNLTIENVQGPEGVRGRNSNNSLIQQELGWQPTQPLETGLKLLYSWIEAEVSKDTKHFINIE